MTTNVAAQDTPQKTVESKLDDLVKIDFPVNDTAMTAIRGASGTPSRSELKDVAKAIQDIQKAVADLRRIERKDYSGTL